jgi:hypothetical protein
MNRIKGLDCPPAIRRVLLTGPWLPLLVRESRRTLPIFSSDFRISLMNEDRRASYEPSVVVKPLVRVKNGVFRRKRDL